MLLSFQIDTSGLTGWSTRLGEALRCDVPGPMQDGMVEALALLMRWEAVRYQDHSTGFGFWPDLATSTKVSRARKSGAFVGRQNRSKPTQADIAKLMHFPILIDTGQLFNSLQQGNPYNELIYEENSITQQSSVPYGIYHMTGTEKMPARVFVVPPDDSALTEASAPIVEGISRAIAASVGA